MIQAFKRILALFCALVLIPAAMAQAEPQTVKPLPATLAIGNLENCTFSASFMPEDVYLNADGALVIHLTVGDYERFDAVDISRLVPGDKIVIDKETVIVNTIKREDGAVFINGEPYADGYTLWPNEDGVYSEVLENDFHHYYDVGEATLAVGQDFVMLDSSDMEQPERTLYAGDLLADMKAAANDPDRYLGFSMLDTEVTVTDGVITKIEHFFMP